MRLRYLLGRLRALRFGRKNECDRFAVLADEGHHFELLSGGDGLPRLWEAYGWPTGELFLRADGALVFVQAGSGLESAVSLAHAADPNRSGDERQSVFVSAPRESTGEPGEDGEVGVELHAGDASDTKRQE